MTIQERLRVWLEQKGVIVPTKAEEVAQAVSEHSLYSDEILLYATLAFRLPFVDTTLVATNNNDEAVTAYGKRLKEAVRLIQNS